MCVFVQKDRNGTGAALARVPTAVKEISFSFGSA